MSLPIANVTQGKAAVQVGLAGADEVGAVLSGLAGTVVWAVPRGEAFYSADVVCVAKDFQADLDCTPVAGGMVEALVVFGTDTASGSPAVKNKIRWTTSLGTQERDLWVVDPPAIGALYAANQECQVGEATVYACLGDPEPENGQVSLAVNVLPTAVDECFDQHEYEGNRYANTRRGWGGASTIELLVSTFLFLRLCKRWGKASFSYISTGS